MSPSNPVRNNSVLRLIALSAESARLRPITMRANLEPNTGSPEHQAVEDFLQFGAPFDGVPGTVIEVTGPPGVATPDPGAGLFRFVPVTDSASGLPDLEVRLLDLDGSTLHAVDLVDVQTSGAAQGPGWYLSGRDRGAAVDFEFFINGSDGHTIKVNGRSLTGKTPNEILPVLRFVADVRDGTAIVVAIRDGGAAVTPTWDMHDEPLARLAQFHLRLVEALATIQRHTKYRISVPDVDSATGEDIDQILRVGRLLQGESIEATWSELPLTVGSPASVPSNTAEFALTALFPLTVRLNGHEIELNMRRRVLYPAAKLAIPTGASAVQTGDVLRIVPGATDRAIITAVPASAPTPGSSDT